MDWADNEEQAAFRTQDVRSFIEDSLPGFYRARQAEVGHAAPASRPTGRKT